jgi:hypothetical protein
MYLIPLIIYFLVGVVWACYAGTKQRQYYPDSDGLHMFLALLINMLAWPMAVVIAYGRYGLFKKHD